MPLIAKLFAANAHSRISLIASQVALALEKTKLTLLILVYSAKTAAVEKQLTAERKQWAAEREQRTAKRKQWAAKEKKMVAENKALLDKIAQLEGKKI